MAMYERDGYCPLNVLGLYELKLRRDERKAAVYRITMNLLKDRRGYLVYDNDYIEYINGYPSICKVCEVPLGTELATVLRRLIPNCIYGKEGKKILLKDIAEVEELNLSKEGIEVLEDEDFIISIKDYKRKIEVKIFKKVER